MTYNEIIDLGLKLGLEEIELYSENVEGNTVKVFNGELSNYNSSNTFGMSIRGKYNNKMCYVYTETLEKDVIETLLKTLIENAKSLTSTETEFLYEGSKEYPKVVNKEADYKNHTLQEKVELLKTLERGAKESDSRIVAAGYCQYAENAVKVRIVNSKGLDLERSTSYMYAFLGLTASDGKNVTMGFAQDINTTFNNIEKDRIIKEAVENAINSLGAESVESGKYSIVFSEDTASDLLQAFSSIFVGESALRKVTSLTDKVGQKVFGENITIIDDPFCDKSIVKIPFDDEGVPCQTKSVVENGVFKGFLHSLKTANAFNTVSTGNGFKPGIKSSVTTTPTNLYLKPGTISKEQLIKNTDKGIYITELNGLHAGLNTISGDFNLQASGFMIENGVKTNPVTLFVISGNFYEMMNNVEEIASNIKDRFNGIASPSFKVKGLMISGK